jgi:hypothetical protein
MNLDRTPVNSTGCSQFYLCALNKMNILSCPVGLLFDQNLGKCNYANQVICKDLTTTTSTVATTMTSSEKIKK